MAKIEEYIEALNRKEERKSIYRLLLVDDEAWVREELETMIDFPKYGITLLKSARDGEEALMRIREEAPDILITDVNMPFLNGVELVKRVKAEHPEIVVIMLSGYGDFEYVKESLLAGAMDYLMKPIAKLDLIQVMTRAMEKINERILSEQSRDATRSELLRASSALSDREYSALLTNTRASQSAGLPGGMKVPEGGFSTILVKLHGSNALAEVFHYDMNLLSYTIKHRISELAGLSILLIFNNIYATSEFVLVVSGATDALKEQAYFLLVALREFTGRTVSIGISEPYFSEHDLHTAYRQAKTALLMRNFSGSSVVNVSGDLLTRISEEENVPRPVEKQMLEMVPAGSKRLSDFVLYEVGLYDANQKGWTLLKTLTLCRAYLRALQTALDMQGQETAEIEEVGNSLFHAVENMEVAEMKAELLLLLNYHQESEEAVSESKSGKETVSRIEADIKEHYFEELSLSTLAEKYHIESTYLSRLFKKETGLNVTNYIAKCRIEKAKDLIRSGRSSITEIAFLVGYDDYNYFNRVFRKLTGISPREFKESVKTS